MVRIVRTVHNDRHSARHPEASQNAYHYERCVQSELSDMCYQLKTMSLVTLIIINNSVVHGHSKVAVGGSKLQGAKERGSREKKCPEEGHKMTKVAVEVTDNGIRVVKELLESLVALAVDIGKPPRVNQSIPFAATGNIFNYRQNKCSNRS